MNRDRIIWKAENLQKHITDKWERIPHRNKIFLGSFSLSFLYIILMVRVCGTSFLDLLLLLMPPLFITFLPILYVLQKEKQVKEDEGYAG